jgi:hypothetical protein
MQEVDEQLQSLMHDGVRLLPFDVDDEADAAGIVLAARIVQALGGRGAGLARSVQEVSHVRHSFVKTVSRSYRLLHY